MKTVTVSELSKVVGVSGARIRKLIERGVLDSAITARPSSKTAPYKLDLAVAQTCISEFVNSRTAVSAGTAKRSRGLREKFLKAQIRKETATAGLRESELRRRDGTLLSADRVRQAAFNMGRAVRDSMLSITDRVSSLLAAETDENVVREILDAEITSALESMQKYDGT